jgi:hypothetical protein
VNPEVEFHEALASMLPSLGTLLRISYEDVQGETIELIVDLANHG